MQLPEIPLYERGKPHAYVELTFVYCPNPDSRIIGLTGFLSSPTDSGVLK